MRKDGGIDAGRGAPEGVLEGQANGSKHQGRVTWIAAVAALILGGLAGFLLGWAFGPTETRTVTETVTDTVTETVTQAPYTTSRHVTVQLSFDGERCLYSGPAELIAGSTVRVRYDSPDQDSGWFLWWLSPWTTYEDLMGSERRGPEDYSGFGDGYMSGGTGFGGRNPWAEIHEGQLLSIGCATRGHVFHAAMLRVLAG
jgi:hypothetical protein